MRVYHRARETLVAACDDDLIGRTLREGRLRLQVSEFYAGDAVTVERLVQHLGLATIGNLVGRETVEAAIDAGYVEESGILWIDGVPHAQFVTV